MLKCPEAFETAISEYTGELDRHEVENIASKYLKYLECVTIEINLDTGQAEVLEA